MKKFNFVLILATVIILVSVFTAKLAEAANPQYVISTLKSCGNQPPTPYYLRYGDKPNDVCGGTGYACGSHGNQGYYVTFWYEKTGQKIAPPEEHTGDTVFCSPSCGFSGCDSANAELEKIRVYCGATYAMDSDRTEPYAVGNYCPGTERCETRKGSNKKTCFPICKVYAEGGYKAQPPYFTEAVKKIVDEFNQRPGQEEVEFEQTPSNSSAKEVGQKMIQKVAEDSVSTNILIAAHSIAAIGVSNVSSKLSYDHRVSYLLYDPPYGVGIPSTFPNWLISLIGLFTSNGEQIEQAKSSGIGGFNSSVKRTIDWTRGLTWPEDEILRQKMHQKYNEDPEVAGSGAAVLNDISGWLNTRCRTGGLAQAPNTKEEVALVLSDIIDQTQIVPLTVSSGPSLWTRILMNIKSLYRSSLALVGLTQTSCSSSIAIDGGGTMKFTYQKGYIFTHLDHPEAQTAYTTIKNSSIGKEGKNLAFVNVLDSVFFPSTNTAFVWMPGAVGDQPTNISGEESMADYSLGLQTWLYGKGINDSCQLTEPLPDRFKNFLEAVATTSNITVTSPATGLSVKPGSTLPITWASTADVSNVMITWVNSVSGASGWVTNPVSTANDTSHIISNTNSYLWTIPTSLEPGTYLVKVFKADPSALDNGALNIAGTSGSFTISLSISGLCGTASGSATPSVPAANLCSAGTASIITLSGTAWNWSCAGTNGGTTATCSAPKSTPTSLLDLEAKTSYATANQIPLGQAVSYTAGMKNTGPDMVTVSVSWIADGQTLITRSVPLSPNMTGWSNIGYSYKPTTVGPHTIQFKMDPANVLIETNETNNVATWTLTVNPASTVSGLCGSAMAVSSATVPISNLCSAGTASSVVPSGSNWTWMCIGSGGGTNASCAAPKSTTGTNGTCGSANNTIVQFTPTSNLCTSGTNSAVTYYSTPTPHYGWGCVGLNGGTTATCSATKSGAITGVCGSAISNPPSYDPPATNLCSVGSASSVSLSATGKWVWNCAGTNGGGTASCSASRLTAVTTCGSATTNAPSATAPTTNLCTTGTPTTPYSSGTAWLWMCLNSNGGKSNCQAPRLATVVSSNGTCGSSNGQTLTSAPTSNLCTAGTASFVTTGTNYTWSCAGTNGGTTASCSANQSATQTPPTATNDFSKLEIKTITSQPANGAMIAGQSVSIYISLRNNGESVANVPLVWSLDGQTVQTKTLPGLNSSFGWLPASYLIPSITAGSHTFRFEVVGGPSATYNFTVPAPSAFSIFEPFALVLRALMLR